VLGTPANGDTLDGGSGADTLSYDQAGVYRLTNAPGSDDVIIEYLGASPGGAALATARMTGFEAFAIRDGRLDLGTIAEGASIEVQVCFAAGTRITTDRGEVAIERLQPGDTVITAGGSAEPVLFVGRRHVTLAGRADAMAMAPIRITAGALADGVPRRDLVVSPDHCMLLDGALVPARLLVNGSTILAEAGRAEVTWFHIELARHEVVLAEGAAAESWLDTGNRAWFANAPVALLTVAGNLDAAGTGWDATRACAPLLHGGTRLAAIRAALGAMPQPALPRAG
jgi:hypothetical protein